MSISVIKKKERQAIPYDGSTMEKAFAWSAVSPSGSTATLSTMTYDSSSYRYVCWVAVQLIATQAYTSSYGSLDCGVELYDAEGTRLAYSEYGWDDEQGTEIANSLSYTPETSGTYYLKYWTGFYDGEYGGGVTVDFSPRPSDPDRPLWMPWETSGGLDAAHLPVLYNTAEEAGIRFDGTTILGLAAITKVLRRVWASMANITWNNLSSALEKEAIRLERYREHDGSLAFGSEDGKVILAANQNGGENGLAFVTKEDIYSLVVRFRLPSIGPSGESGREYPIISSDLCQIALHCMPSRESDLPAGVQPPSGLYEPIGTSSAKAFIRINNKEEYKILHVWNDANDESHYSWTTDQEHDWREAGAFWLEISPEQYIGQSEWHTIAASYIPPSDGLIVSENDDYIYYYGGRLLLYMDGVKVVDYTIPDNELARDIYKVDRTPGRIWIAARPGGGSSAYSAVDIDMDSLRFYTRALNWDKLKVASRY